MADGENAGSEAVADSELLEATTEAIATPAAAGQKAEAGSAKEHRLELTGMKCESCERLVRRAAKKAGAEVAAIDANAGYATFVCTGDELSALRLELAKKGFSERGSEAGGRGDFGRIREYFSAMLEGREEVEVESALLKYALGSFAALLVIAAAVYAFALKGMANASGYAQFFLLALGSAVALSFSYYHLGSYRRSLSCTNGMMAGMTLGMMAGFLVGAIVGATNGMFVGSLAGMAAGIALGVGVGKHCGIMGALEGGMAGIMAGTMGAMLSVMMVNDHLMAFLYVLFALCVLVLAGLSYMMHRESAEEVRSEHLNAGFVDFAMFASVLVLGMGLLMLLGPKTGLIYQ
jgi:hypothetical protein